MKDRKIKNNFSSNWNVNVTDKSGVDELDLIELMNVLWCKRKLIFIITCIFAVAGVFVAFVYPHKWTSIAVLHLQSLFVWLSLRKH
ncbi:TPA: Wzz/FepE/Etk N-terminal domain-containing protein [Salmonella enterica]|nr:hypothetical protein [Salmonella enterica subsp. enterica]ECW0788949.1 hypothetical protein [Salmonella enterica subsp. enterica]